MTLELSLLIIKTAAWRVSETHSEVLELTSRCSSGLHLVTLLSVGCGALNKVPLCNPEPCVSDIKQMSVQVLGN